VTSVPDRTVEIRFGLRQPAAEEGREAFSILANMARLTNEKLVALASLPEILSAGRHILGRTRQTDWAWSAIKPRPRSHGPESIYDIALPKIRVWLELH